MKVQGQTVDFNTWFFMKRTRNLIRVAVATGGKLLKTTGYFGRNMSTETATYEGNSQWRMLGSVKTVTPGTAAFEGPTFATENILTIGKKYEVVVGVEGTPNKQLMLGTALGNYTNIDTNGRLEEYSYKFTATGTNHDVTLTTRETPQVVSIYIAYVVVRER